MQVRTFIAKAIGTIIVVSVSLPIGKEGPMVQIVRVPHANRRAEAHADLSSSVAHLHALASSQIGQQRSLLSLSLSLSLSLTFSCSLFPDTHFGSLSLSLFPLALSFPLTPP